MFGNLSPIEFEKKLISSIASTAIEPDSLSAEEGMLHEIEFINPYTVDDRKPVLLKGLLWIKESLENGFSFIKEDGKLFIKYDTQQVSFNELVNSFQIGGERKYGFGLVTLDEFREVNDYNLTNLNFTGKWIEKNNEVYLTLYQDNLVWSHISYSNDISIKGNIEPLVGRDWGNDGAGRRLDTRGLFWSPGSVLNKDKTFKIIEFGLWKTES
jgi:hypothetical protein